MAAQTVAVAALVALAACGGGGSPGGPSPNPGGGPGPVGATVTIGANGAVSPTQVTIAVGQSVNFVNSDSRPHDVSSDPHPAHSDCAQTNTIGLLSNGQSKTTNAYTAARTCG